MMLSDAQDSLVTGLGRHMVMILDNIAVAGDDPGRWLAYYEATGSIPDDALQQVGATQEELAGPLAEVERQRKYIGHLAECWLRHYD